MNDLSELFRATADAAPDASGLAGRVHRRAARDRRTRVTTRAVGALAGAALVAGSAVAVGAARDDDPSFYVALGTDGVARVGRTPEDCRGYAARIPGTEVPERLRLVAAGADHVQARPAFARRMTSTGDCHTAAVALALLDTTPDGRLRRQLSLSGPLPAPLQVGPPEARDVRLRGTTGRLVVVGGRVTAATWTEPGGGSWALHTTGNTKAEVVAYVDALVLPEGSGPARLPAAMTRGYRDLGYSAERRGGGSRVRWSVEYRNAAGHLVEVEAEEIDAPPAAWLAGGRGELSREVDVAGTRGVYFTNGARFGHGLQGLQWEASDGVVAMVSGVDLTLDELRALAENLRNAADDDPVVTASE